MRIGGKYQSVDELPELQDIAMGGSSLKIQAAFVDRDGTLGGNGHFIYPRDFELYPSSLAALHPKIRVKLSHRTMNGTM
ncbi:hypothetical protein KZ483_14935 [Paenibacillus sp. sptzw28]|uniref:hypothetical protein n=1 Tax=Paenibacillus sp. sptzw28 TaxID=715179 RepID=UPI001C6E0464|nr:hypothetical protein [Paenibacillus sp. sptzw28]QYR19246.1 hypothetical protein KZ483_14935 [Paenibacillus sp. sptzw28]